MSSNFNIDWIFWEKIVLKTSNNIVVKEIIVYNQAYVSPNKFMKKSEYIRFEFFGDTRAS